jgi:hypothetical protein
MKKLFYPFSIALLVAIAIGCSKENLKPNHVNSPENGMGTSSIKRLATTQADFSDEDLFVGIFFLKGGVSNEIQSLVDLKNNINNGGVKLTVK